MFGPLQRCRTKAGAALPGNGSRENSNQEYSDGVGATPLVSHWPISRTL
jgi:hypothetical protein